MKKFQLFQIERKENAKSIVYTVKDAAGNVITTMKTTSKREYICFIGCTTKDGKHFIDYKVGRPDLLRNHVKAVESRISQMEAGSTSDQYWIAFLNDGEDLPGNLVRKWTVWSQWLNCQSFMDWSGYLGGVDEVIKDTLTAEKSPWEELDDYVREMKAQEAARLQPSAEQEAGDSLDQALSHGALKCLAFSPKDIEALLGNTNSPQYQGRTLVEEIPFNVVFDYDFLGYRIICTQRGEWQILNQVDWTNVAPGGVNYPSLHRARMGAVKLFIANYGDAALIYWCLDGSAGYDLDRIKRLAAMRGVTFPEWFFILNEEVTNYRGRRTRKDVISDIFKRQGLLSARWMENCPTHMILKGSVSTLAKVRLINELQAAFEACQLALSFTAKPDYIIVG